MQSPLVLGLGALALSACVSACVSTPPANWARGGALLDIAPARWVRGDAVIEIAPDGSVGYNGEHVLTLDRGGRVSDADGQPVALLEPDGRVVGPGDALLGQVGYASAALPGEETAWLSIQPTGEVLHYDADGVRGSMGVWVGGCNASVLAHQSCMLVSHLMGMRLRAQRPYSPMYPTAYGAGPLVPRFSIGFSVFH